MFITILALYLNEMRRSSNGKKKKKKVKGKGKEKDKNGDKHKGVEKARRRSNHLASLCVSVLLVAAAVLLSHSFGWSETEQRPHFLGRLCCVVLMDSTLGQFFAYILIHPARLFVRFAMPPTSSSVGDNTSKSCGPTDAENASNDDSLPWPRSEVRF